MYDDMRFLFLGAIKKVVGGNWDTKEVATIAGCSAPYVTPVNYHNVCAGKLKALKVV